MLKESLLEKVLTKALSNGADFAEVFVEDTYNSSIQLLDKQIKRAIEGKDYGAGIRVFYGAKAIYAFTNDLSEKSLMAAADAVSKADIGNANITSIDLMRKEFVSPHKIAIPFEIIAKKEKIDFMRRIDKAAREYSNLISQVSISYTETEQKIQIANSDGLLTNDARTYARVYVSSIASKGNEMQTGGEGPGAQRGYEFFQKLNPEELGRKTAKQAVTMILAEYAPSGKFPVVIGNGFGGVIFHEASGHSLETTSVAKGASVFADKMGKQIANQCVTAIDDGTIPNAWGSTTIDDEGNLTQKTVLIKNGILKSFMIDRLGGIKVGMKSTGSGRRQSYKFAPTSRMRNTYIAAGNDEFDDMVASIDFGIYAKKMGGGSVQPGTGDFNFAVAEGYLIENGKITKPVRGATLVGNGAKILHKISMVGKDLKFAEGMCGSVSGNVPVRVGQPTIKVDEIVVGGRK
ncbi:MAG: TldD/PmbA family protein [Candidatus Cloacimonetes bacterium]|nr:TldD/PmbA family protein [Candidatus Cloacimonadota bacterium]